MHKLILAWGEIYYIYIQIFLGQIWPNMCIVLFLFYFFIFKFKLYDFVIVRPKVKQNINLEINNEI